MPGSTSFRTAAVFVSACAGLTLWTCPAAAQSATDAFNVPNVTVTSHSDTFSSPNDNSAADTIYNMFGATNVNTGSAAGEPSTRTVFADNNAFPVFVNFNIASPGLGLGIAGVSLYVSGDIADGGNRGVSAFALFADVDANGSYETTLVSGVNPLDNGSINTYPFLPTAATRFRAEFSPNAVPNFLGPRVDELDAITAPIPEPASLAVLSLGSLGLLARRRRARGV